MNKFASLVALSLLFSGGCSSESRVTGVVTLDGVPVENGGVTFHFDGDGPTAVGDLGPGGKYELKIGSSNRIPSGKYLVTVVGYGPIKEMPPGVAPPPPPLLTPIKYRDKQQSELKFEIAPGISDIPIKLISK